MNVERQRCYVRDLGLDPYSSTYRLQKELVARKKEDFLLFVEHPNVVTYGRKSKVVPHSENTFAVERGGEATFHGPGQLVGYPILNLKGEERDVSQFLRNIERLLIESLYAFGIVGETREGATGVWVKGQEKKIASIGIAIKAWTSFHGFALNVNNDLSGFLAIQPCGFSPSVMTSMKQILGPKCPSLSQVKLELKTRFGELFNRDMLGVASHDRAMGVC